MSETQNQTNGFRPFWMVCGIHLAVFLIMILGSVGILSASSYYADAAFINLFFLNMVLAIVDFAVFLALLPFKKFSAAFGFLLSALVAVLVGFGFCLAKFN